MGAAGRWPLHQIPGEYEILSPWIRRLARAYGVADRVFSQHALGCPAGEAMETNAYPPVGMLERLEAGTGVPTRRLRDMTTDRMMARTIAELRQVIMMGPEPVPRTPALVAGRAGFVDVIWRRAGPACGPRPPCAPQPDGSGTAAEEGGALMPDVLGYARVSTPGQDLEGQRRRLTEEAGAIRVFDDVVSGRTFERPGLEALIDYAREGDTVCVVRLDRLGRSLRELLETVERFKAARLEFRSLEDRLDTASAAGELVFHVFGAIAHLERRLIVERTRDGLKAARARGAKPGRPALDPDKLDAALLLIRGGLSPTRAAKQVGLGRSTLYRELAFRGSDRTVTSSSTNADAGFEM
jgi:DNA invertase Pin-like site-specific DNA recombinase